MQMSYGSRNSILKSKLRRSSMAVGDDLRLNESIGK